jgi:hypothetical protein
MSNARPSRPPQMKRAIGKKIAGFETEYVRAESTDGREATWNVRCIYLEDGSRLVPFVDECDGDYAVTFKIYPKKS